MIVYRQLMVLLLFWFLGEAIGQNTHPAVTPMPVAPPKTIETQNLRDVRNEPIFKGGNAVQTINVKNLPKPLQDEETLSLQGAQWYDSEAFSLAVKARKLIPVNLTAPALLLIKVDWRGASAPVQVLLLRGTAVAATGAALTTSPGGGRTSLQTSVATAGKLVVSIQNIGGSRAEINVVIASVLQTDRTNQ